MGFNGAFDDARRTRGLYYIHKSCFCFFMYDLSGRDLITSGGARTTKLIILYVFNAIFHIKHIKKLIPKCPINMDLFSLFLQICHDHCTQQQNSEHNISLLRGRCLGSTQGGAVQSGAPKHLCIFPSHLVNAKNLNVRELSCHHNVVI